MANVPFTYNSGPMFNLDDIPKEDLNRALNEFSDGSPGLKKCLTTMWNNNLKTLACKPGNNDGFDEAYILMEENIDLFSYLSDELLLNDMVAIFHDEYNRQSIRFIGPIIYKERFFNILSRDIITGKKHNEQNLKEKINKPIPQEWRVHGLVFQMLKDLIPTVGPIKRIKLQLLCNQLNEGTIIDQRRIIQTCYRELAMARNEEKRVRK